VFKDITLHPIICVQLAKINAKYVHLHQIAQNAKAAILSIITFAFAHRVNFKTTQQNHA